MSKLVNPKTWTYVACSNLRNLYLCSPDKHQSSEQPLELFLERWRGRKLRESFCVTSFKLGCSGHSGVSLYYEFSSHHLCRKEPRWHVNSLSSLTMNGSNGKTEKISVLRYLPDFIRFHNSLLQNTNLRGPFLNIRKTIDGVIKMLMSGNR